MEPDAGAAACGHGSTAAGVETQNIDTSLYFRDPDGARVEIIADPLGEMYGTFHL